MGKLIVNGGHRLTGAVTVHGAKNAALPLLAASLLPKGGSELHNCPRLSDVRASQEILRHLGCEVRQEGDVVSVYTQADCRADVPDRLMRGMRSSIVFLGAILAKTGEAMLAFPGGCELGPRPIDWHLAALSRMGVCVREEGGLLHCRAEHGLHGAKIALSFPSVGATENVLLAAVTADGVTEISNAAREPEITDLCAYLVACGARIRDGGEGRLSVEGVPALHGCAYSVMPDRIEAATYMAAAAATGGTLVLKRVKSGHLTAVCSAFEEAGCALSVWQDEMLISAPPRLRRIRTVRTMPYPGFPTDAQAPVMAMMTIADGTSLFIENIFENRYRHAEQLFRMGARIKTEGRIAVVEGVPALTGASVECTDLRGGAALVVAALSAEGETEIGQIQHLDRGYERLETELAAVGADIKRA